MSKMIGCEVHLYPIIVQRTILNAHHAGTVDENINRRYIWPSEYFFSRFSDRLSIRQVDLEKPIVDAREVDSEGGN